MCWRPLLLWRCAAAVRRSSSSGSPTPALVEGLSITTRLKHGVRLDQATPLLSFTREAERRPCFAIP